ncbi:hypothetical protein ACIQW5_25970 [Methylorubrum thiocyanatum]|uniref:hypothetical protein n=1 Tax=Methylorubrum thiocyanatum TaxID=47958 RepID=UPI00383AD01F
MSAKPAQTLDELYARIQATRATTPAGPERQFRHAVRGEEARQGRRGNGGPDLDAPEPVVMRGCAREVLDLGALLFGDRYTTDLARVTGELPRQVYRWQRGEGTGPSETAVRWIREEALARMAAIQAGLDRLAAVRPPALPPAAPEPEPEVTLAPGVAPEDARWFLDGLSRALTPGRPTFVREVLSARRPPRARHWTAEVRVFDGAVHTLDCDRGADAEGTTVGLAWIPGPGLTSRQPCLLWDDAAGWVRGADFVRGPRPPAPAAPEPEPALAAPARPADPQVDLEEWLATTGLIGE